MKQKQFEIEHEQLWAQVEVILSGNNKDKKKRSKNKTTLRAGTDQSTLGIAQDEALPVLYRRLCQSLALCMQRGYSPSLTQYLQKLVSDGHRRLYGTAVERPTTLYQWLFQEMPRRVRQEWRLLLLSFICFWGVGLGIGLLVWFQPHWAYSFMSPEELNQISAMYQPSKTAIGRGGTEGDWMMFGYYIWNNVSIDFRTFAGGIFGGIPALLSIIFNGMNIGVVASWLSKDPATRETFWSFVITHSSFEIAGLLLSGMAGIRMGLALISPGRLTRQHALIATSKWVFPILIGAAMLTVIAAFFEGFWSASTSITPTVKYAVGGIGWLLLILFFALAGRSSR